MAITSKEELFATIEELDGRITNLQATIDAMQPVEDEPKPEDTEPKEDEPKEDEPSKEELDEIEEMFND